MKLKVEKRRFAHKKGFSFSTLNFSQKTAYLENLVTKQLDLYSWCEEKVSTLATIDSILLGAATIFIDNFVDVNEGNRTISIATRIKGVKRVTIESRPQYLSEKTVLFLADIFNSSGVELEIGMGLEAENDVVRNICINKRGTREQFEKTVNLLKKHNIYSLAYILLKPPFLTEKEAIDEAVETAHFAANIGFSRISFEPMSIHQYTLADLLKENGDYKPPWLWSVIEVAKRCSDISNIFGIGGVGYYPVPTEYAHNYCMEKDDCNRKIIEAIKKYNEIRDVSVFEHLDL